MIPLDQPGPVRAGDELDRRALETWLLGHLRDARGPLLVRQFPHGFSNLNYLLDLGTRELVLRRAPPGAGVTHDAGREYRLLASLRPAWNKVPEPLAYCPDPGVIGAPFLVTRRVRGAILRRNLPASGFDGARLAALGDGFAATLAELHRIDAPLAALGDVVRVWGEAQVEGWWRRYQAARTPDSPDLGPLLRWLRRRLPADSDATLVHNDFRYDNLVLDAQDPARVLALLDWELAARADPRLDLGIALSYWVEARDPAELQAFGITHLPGNPDRAGIVAAYERHARRRIADPVVLYGYGLLRLAGVLQQIYARFCRAGVVDARRARVIGMVHDVADLAARAIRLDRISRLY